jgi:hypothetical protein
MMRLVNEQQVSPCRIAAKQRNALKSIGPRTAEGKRRSSWSAMRRRLCPKAFREAMRSLNQSPQRFERLYQDLIDCCRPANALEAMLVEDHAKLWWKKGRAERAQAGVQSQQVERLQVERRREFHDVNHLSTDRPGIEVEMKDEVARKAQMPGTSWFEPNA